MARIIVLENGASSACLSQSVQQATAVKDSSVTALTREGSEGLGDIQSIHLSDTPISQDIWNLVSEEENELILFLDARLEISSDSLSGILAQARRIDSAITLCEISDGEQTAEFSSISAEQMTQNLLPGALWPTGIVVVKNSLLSDIEPFEALSASEFLVMLCIAAIGTHHSVDTYAENMIVSEETLMETMALADQQLARCLRYAVNTVNIEELFPNHAWEQHGNESAAASYHTIAALFIKLGDMESALECLGLSDQLEDSPRSLGLRGLIALCKGETLQAVANMVSSLQEYEKRKDPDSVNHYLAFAPRDLEKINLDLQSGLEALNKRDNTKALDYFADAVFQFDSFYEDCGLDLLRHMN